MLLDIHQLWKHCVRAKLKTHGIDTVAGRGCWFSSVSC
jgi:hypothetical protein